MEVIYIDQSSVNIRIDSTLYSSGVVHKCFYWYAANYSIAIITEEKTFVVKLTALKNPAFVISTLWSKTRHQIILSKSSSLYYKFESSLPSPICFIKIIISFLVTQFYLQTKSTTLSINSFVISIADGSDPPIAPPDTLTFGSTSISIQTCFLLIYYPFTFLISAFFYKLFSIEFSCVWFRFAYGISGFF